MTRPRETLSRVDDAMARFEQALEALRQIPKDGHRVTIDGIEHELLSLIRRLRSLRDEVAGDGSRKSEIGVWK